MAVPRLAAVLLLLVVVVSRANGDPKPDGTLRIVPDEQGLLIVDEDLPVLFYQRATRSFQEKWSRANYVHPLHGLDGQVLTEDFPEDHRHHRGVFWAWHQVRVGEKLIGDPWICRDFEWDVTHVETSTTQDAAKITADVLWKSPLHLDSEGQKTPLLRETTTITIHKRQPDYRCIDFDISLLAMVDHLAIGGSDDQKGYGGFSPRLKLHDDTRFESTDGELNPTTLAIEAGPWVNVESGHSGVAIIVHRDNPERGDRFILRRKRSMQNAVYPGQTPVAVSTVTPTRLRYRLVVHGGGLGATVLTKLSQEFSDTND